MRRRKVVIVSFYSKDFEWEKVLGAVEPEDRVLLQKLREKSSIIAQDLGLTLTAYRRINKALEQAGLHYRLSTEMPMWDYRAVALASVRPA